MTSSDLSGFSMLELFRLETDTQAQLLVSGLLELERDPTATSPLEGLMRAAHSLKGAARLVNIEPAVKVAHAMEDVFSSAQNTGRLLNRPSIDALLAGVDLLTRIAGEAEAAAAEPEAAAVQALDAEVRAFLERLAHPEAHQTPPPPPPTAAPVAASPPVVPPEPAAPATLPATPVPEPPLPEAHPIAAAPPRAHQALAAAPASEQRAGTGKEAVRVSAENLDLLLKLSGEAVVASRWLGEFTRDLERLRRLQRETSSLVADLRLALPQTSADGAGEAEIKAGGIAAELETRVESLSESLTAKLADIDSFDQRVARLADSLHAGVLDCRMRPFSHGVQGFARMVRDAARVLGKEVNFVLDGEDTPVDREILEKIEAPLGHLLRNAVDHGIETGADRLARGKAEVGTIRLEARHHAGVLLMSVEDDGRGIDVAEVRRVAIGKGLVTAELADELSMDELLEFPFLPGFTTRGEVTEISGRGVGLDVVQTLIKEVGGTVRILPGQESGTRVELRLPLTLSVLRLIVVQIGRELYAFPLARVHRALKLPHSSIESIEGRQHFSFDGRQIGLVAAAQVLGLEDALPGGEEIAVLLLGEAGKEYGVAVDRLVDEKELVVRPLDPRLGKIPDISSAALMPDLSPVLIIDTQDFIRSIENLASGSRLARLWQGGREEMVQARKRVLVVDDSLTVRELERKLIESRGYEVEVAVNGMDGWNAVRTGAYDLVVTDVDMPRLGGIELVTLIKSDARLAKLPVMIVSYKDREDDKRRGLDAGADYYLAKSGFHDETLLVAIADLIGEAQS